MRFSRKLAIGATAGAVVATVALFPAAQSQPVAAQNQPEPANARARTGNVIFIHPDGTGANTWGAGRIYWRGPDADLEWDKLDTMTFYRGHMLDLLTGTSNGGATTHAFGYKVEGLGSFGKDGDGDAARSIRALSGFGGSILREAASKGHPIGVVNDGDVAEPGTGAFLAEVGNRDDALEIALQMLEGRPGANDRDPVVIMGGGEAFFLPQGTPACAGTPQPNCAVHVDPIDGATAARTDGRNLIQEAINDGWTVVRTRAEFEALQTRLERERNFRPKVLGLFAANDTFNDVPEEVLKTRNLIDPSIPATDKRSNLILWGSAPGTLGYNPPTAAEMTQAALLILDRHSDRAGRPFMLVTEVESTDNFGNNNNAIGTLNAVDRADKVISVAREFRQRDARTMILTAADSDGGGMQLLSLPQAQANTNVSTVNLNPTGDRAQQINAPVDGITGRDTLPFRAAPDAFGKELPFGITWIGTPDVAGGIISKAEGPNANLLETRFGTQFDNSDVYRLMYLTLFGRLLPDSEGKLAPSR